MDFKNTRLSLQRPISSYTRIQNFWGFMVRNSRKQLSKASYRDKELINIGCGSNIDKKFFNVDYQWRPGLDLCWDITKGIPLESGLFKGAYTEHCLEHISFSEAKDVLKEINRLLVPKGVLRIIVPDAELYLDLYQRHKLGELVSFPYVTEEDLERGFSPIMSVNRVFREHGHLYAYDFDCLSLMLKESGFVDIRKEHYKVGRAKDLLIDSESRKIESLYIEAIKPT